MVTQACTQVKFLQTTRRLFLKPRSQRVGKRSLKLVSINRFIADFDIRAFPVHL